MHSVSLSPALATELSFNAEHARFESNIHPKGINAQDKKRQHMHVKRVESPDEYKAALRSWGVKAEKQWNYLSSEPFQMRYMLVAGILRKYKNILEIGSYRTPVFKYLEDEKKNVIAIDPLVNEEVKNDRQRSYMLDFRCLRMAPFGGEPYALVILGLDLPITGKLHKLIRNAEVAVLEFPEDEQWKKSREQYDTLKQQLGLHELSSVLMDFDGNDFSRYTKESEWPPRTKRYIKVVSFKHENPEQLGDTSPYEKGLEVLDTTDCKLLNNEFIASNMFPDAAFEFSHGANAATNYLGGGMLYYTFVHMLRARVAVCLGSGGGFVPRLIRQAQRDLGLADVSRTILIDGNMGPFGRPNWLEDGSFFRTNYDDIELFIADTGSAAEQLAEQGVRIDYLHIDADHSHQGSLRDFNNYLPLMQKDGMVTFHDTKPGSHPSVDCWKTLDDIREMGHEVVDMPFVGGGVAIIRIKGSEDGKFSP